MSCAATRAARTPGTRSSPAARRSRSAQTPSGVISGKTSVIGAGCVVDPQVLLDELDELDCARHRRVGRRRLRERAPDHAVARRDRPGVRAAARPAADRHDAARHRPGVRRQGVAHRHPRAGRARPEDPAPEDRGRARREEPLAGAHLRGRADSTSRRSGRATRASRSGWRPYVGDVSLLVDRALREGKRRALRGRAGDAARPRPRHVSVRHLVEPDRVRSARPGIGIGPTRIDRVLGVSKAYVTRVGEGPFPSEIAGPDQDRLRELGGEYGTVTGRERRCGWLDLVALRYAVRVNGMTSLALTKLDVLSAFGSCRSASVTACATARRRRTSPRTSPTSTTPSRCGRRCPAGRGRSTRHPRSTSCRPRRATTSRSSRARSVCRSSSSASALRATVCSRDVIAFSADAWTQVDRRRFDLRPRRRHDRARDRLPARREERSGRAAAPPRADGTTRLDGTVRSPGVSTSATTAGSSATVTTSSSS